MPKLLQKYPNNIVFRASIAQRNYLDEMASLHGITPSEYLRGLIENARVDNATATIDRILPEVRVRA